MITLTKEVPTPLRIFNEAEHLLPHLRAGYQLSLWQHPDHAVGGNFDMQATVRREPDGQVIIGWPHAKPLPFLAARELADMIRRAVACGRASEEDFMDLARSAWPPPEAAATDPEPKAAALV